MSQRSTVLSLKLFSPPPPQCGVDLKGQKIIFSAITLATKGLYLQRMTKKKARIISYLTENTVPVMNSHYGQTPYRYVGFHAKCPSILYDRIQQRDVSTNIKSYYNLSSCIFGVIISIRIIYLYHQLQDPTPHPHTPTLTSLS